MTRKADTTSRSSPLWTAGVVVITLLGMVSIFGGLGLIIYLTRPAPPDPQPSKLLAEARASDEVALNTFGWVDKQKGVVHIPIALAMEKVLNEGTHSATAPTSRGSP